MSKVIKQNRELIAVEMEAYAVMSAVEYSTSSAKAVIIKSVCDFGTSAKDDRWQKYAAFTSARFFFEFFQTL